LRISAIIPTKDRPGLLAETLASLLACRPAPDEVIVVDAGEREPATAVIDAAAAAGPDVRVLGLRGTRGACRQRNRAIDEATGDVLVFLDDDVLLAPDALARVRDAFSDPGVAGVTGKVVEPSPRRISAKHSPLRRLLAGGREQGTFLASGYPNRLWDLETRRDVEVMAGCFMAARADVARAVRFDVELEAPSGYASLDDEDFSVGVSRRGRVVYEPSAVLEHRNTGFSSADQRAFNRFLVRNRAYTFRKSFRPTPFAWLQWWLVMALHLGHRALNRDWDGLRGLLDGLRQVARRP
jgi:glycosyltransferase involved in cell wall biosynthesis